MVRNELTPPESVTTSISLTPHDGTVTVSELVAEVSLHISALTPLGDTPRTVRYVYATELIDPSPYLRDEELILSVGVPVAHQSASVIRNYVRTLKAQRVTALLIGIGDIFDQPPAELVSACRDADLPLLIQDAGVPFRRIVDWVDSTRSTARTIDAAERDLGSMLHWFIAGTMGVDPIANTLATRGLHHASVAVCAFARDGHGDAHTLVDPHGGLVAAFDNQIIGLCGHTSEFAAALAGSNVVCGVAIAPDPQAMAHAIPEAFEALHEALRCGRAVRIDEITTLQGLLAAVPKVRLVPFVQRLLVPLVEYDRTNSGHLVASLRAFLTPENDISAAAAQLYVHTNTLRNRLAKITELTGSNPLVETERINFRIALWAAHHMGMRVPT